MNHSKGNIESPEVFTHSKRIFTCKEGEKGVLDMLLKTHPDIGVVFGDHPSLDLKGEGYAQHIDFHYDHAGFARNYFAGEQKHGSIVEVKEIRFSLHNAINNPQKKCYINGVFFPKSVVREIGKLSEEKREQVFARIEDTIGSTPQYFQNIVHIADRWRSNIESNDSNMLFIGSADSISVIHIAHILLGKNVNTERIHEVISGKRNFPVEIHRSILREIIFPQKTDFRELAVDSSNSSSKKEQQLKHMLGWIIASKDRIIKVEEKRKIEEYLSDTKNHNSPFYREIQEMYNYYQKRQIWKIIRYVKSRYQLLEEMSQGIRENKNGQQKRILWGDSSLSNIDSRLGKGFREHVYEILKFEKDGHEEKGNVITIEDIEGYNGKPALEEKTKGMQGGHLFPRMLFDYCSAMQKRTLKGNYTLGDEELQTTFHIDGLFEGEGEENNFGIQVYTGPNHKTHSIESSREKLRRIQGNIIKAVERKEDFKVFDDRGEVIREIPRDAIAHQLILVHMALEQEERDELAEYYEKYDIGQEKHIFSGWDEDNIAIRSKHVGDALNTILGIFSQRDDTKIKKEVEKLITGKVRNLVSQTNKDGGITIQIIEPRSSFMIGEITLFFDILQYTSKTAKKTRRPSKAELERQKKQKVKRKERKERGKYSGRLPSY